MAMEGIPELGAVCAMYATDDRYTDDVHYHGRRAARARPHRLPAVHDRDERAAADARGVGDGQRHRLGSEWQRRIEHNEPWLLEWLRHPLPDETWRRGSVRLGPTARGTDG